MDAMDLHDVSASTYLQLFNIDLYFKDAVAQLLSARHKYPSAASADQFFADYFRSVQSGTHVLFREFEFIMATQHNRRSFVNLFGQSVAPIAHQGERMSVADYHNIVRLLCKDFPIAIIKASAAMLVVEDDLECLVAHRDFLAAFKVQMGFHEFLERCTELFSECQSATVTLDADGRGNIVRTDAFLLRLEQLKLPPDVATIPLEIAASAVAGMTESVTVNDIFLSFIRSQAVINLADSPQTGGY
eukprot:m.423942 g.423942  ORF g.423942 m.423942 type:complete len:245 (+) comp21335_c0_seq3:199-933(+)